MSDHANKSTNRVTNTTTEIATDPSALLMHLIGGSAAVEASERAGQAELVKSEVLPVALHGQKDLFEALGFVLGDVVEGDDLFRHVTLPPGWSRRGTEHPMWSEIVDAEGRPRVKVFYKATFYDRRADAEVVGRYEWARKDPEAKRGDPHWTVKDLKTGAIVCDPPTREESVEACRAFVVERTEGKNPVQQWAEP